MTDRELIAEASKIGKVSMQDAARIVTAIETLGYVCVPRVPTEEMLHAAWSDALAEDARGVWETMIKQHQDSVLEKREGG